MNVFPFVEAEKAEQGNVAKACELLEVSRSAYYEWSKNIPSPRQLTDDELGEGIEKIHKASRRPMAPHGCTRRVLRGRLLSARTTASRSPRGCRARSVPFGKYWRNRPLVFSLVPPCQGLWGSQKKMSRPVSMRSWACWAISAPWSQVNDRRSRSGSVVIALAVDRRRSARSAGRPAGAAHDAGGGVEQTVAKRLGFGSGELTWGDRPGDAMRGARPPRAPAQHARSVTKRRNGMRSNPVLQRLGRVSTRAWRRWRSLRATGSPVQFKVTGDASRRDPTRELGAGVGLLATTDGTDA